MVKVKNKSKSETLADQVRAAAAEFAQTGKLEQEARALYYKDKHKGKTLIELAREQNRAQQVKEYLSGLKTMVEAEFDALRLDLIPNQMEADGIENLTIEDLGRLGLTADLYVSIKAGKKEEFFSWLNKHRLGDLIQDSVNPSTLKSFVKSRMDAGKGVPGELLNVTPYTRASITKA